MIGSIAFHAAPIKIANVHRNANDCIVVPPGWCRRVGCRRGATTAASRRASHVRRLDEQIIHNRS
jgi:hypothetical protein